MQDALGNQHTTSNPAALELWIDTLDQYLASSALTMTTLERLLAADPTLPMAVAFRGYMLKLAADPRFKTPIEKCYQSLANRDDLNEHEKMHVQALAYWQEDRLEDAARLFDEITTRHPHDILALRVAHYLYFYSKGGSAMQASLAHAIDHWDRSDRFFGYLKGMEAFALEESGNYEQAESSGRHALDIAPHDIWAAHAVTHVFQMTHRFDEGISFVESLDGNWDGVNNFVNHMHWHKALLHIGLNEYDAALAIYDSKLIEPLDDDFYLDVCNAASLLWRLNMKGIDTRDRWEQLLSYSEPRVTDDELVFTTLHYLIAPVIMGQTDCIDQCVNHFEHWATRPTSQGAVSTTVGLPVAKALKLIADKKYSEGASALAGVRQYIDRIGGSHAQRALFTDLIDHYQAA